MQGPLFHLDQSAQDSLQTQIRTMIIKAIMEGHIPADSPVPSCRELARQLSVSRNTVILSYEKLVEDGFLYARERSGYFVSPDFQPSSMRQSTLPEQTEEGSQLNWTRHFAIQPSSLQNIRKPSDWKDYPYPFIYGQLDDALFPFNEWRECIREANSRQAIRNWSVDSFDGDSPMLIEQLRTHILPERGVWAKDNEVLITLGTQNSLYIISQLLVNPETVVGIEDPGYVDARNIFETSGAKVVPIPLDEEGLVIDGRIKRCDIVFTTPSHQSPTTITMTLQRRKALLKAARRYNIILIEDDYDSEANFLNDPTPALKSLDRDGRVLYVSSLSKTLAPGLRLGYMVAPQPFVKEARTLRRLILRHPPSNNQRTVGLFIARGYYGTLTHRLATKYNERWNEMLEGLLEYLPYLKYTPTYGGTSFWARLPKGLSSKRLVTRATKYGILIESGDIHFKNKRSSQNFIRLSFSAIDACHIKPGLQQLHKTIQDLGYPKASR